MMGLVDRTRSISRRDMFIAVAVALVVAIIGLVVVVSRASSPYASYETEDGAVGGNGPVTTGSDAAASGGKYVQFNPKQ